MLQDTSHMDIRLRRFILSIVVRKRFIRDVEQEIQLLSNIIHNNLSRLLESNLITMNIYRVLLAHLDEYQDVIKYPAPLKTRIRNICEARRSLLNLLRVIPPDNICCLLDILGYTGAISADLIERIQAISEYFLPVSFEVFTLKNANILQRSPMSNRLSHNRIKDDMTIPNIYYLTSLYYDKEITAKEFLMERIRHSLCNKNVYLETHGYQLSVAVANKIVVITGLNNKHINLAISDKQVEIFHHFTDNIEFNSSPIRHQFLDSLWTLDYYCDNILAHALERFRYLSQLYNDTININIAELIKNIIQTPFIKQRDIIIALLCDSENQNSIYLAQLILDIIDTSAVSSVNNPVLTVFLSLPPKFQRFIIESPDYINKATNLISNIDVEESITPEQRIHALNTTTAIKAKALAKLKEIQTSKGEGNAKAQQYIDGLLRVPFGRYMEESIKTHQNTLRNIIVGIADSIRNMGKECPPGLIDMPWTDFIDWVQYIADYLANLSSAPLTTLDNIIRTDETICGAVGEFFERYTKDEWLLLLKSYANIDISGIVLPRNKKQAISSILQLPITPIQALNFTNRCMSVPAIDIPMIYNTIHSALTNYKKHQEDYFKNIDTILDSAIFGMDEPKIEIKRLLAQWLSGRNQGHVIGLEGPPGTGKTSIVKRGIAKCLRNTDGRDRPCVFIPIGGSSNGSILEGHNYTYVGSSWGRIIEGVMDAGCMNPIIYIDELDKISKTENGKEIIGILTHFTDPSQNTEFTDKYFSGIHFDMSKAVVIFSYNDASAIDRILLDRIQRIHIQPLKRPEKIEVVHRHIMPEIMENLGLNPHTYKISSDAIEYIIDYYTYEAGCRKLKERLYEFWREWNYARLRGQSYLTLNNHTATLADIKKVLKAHDKIEITTIHKSPQVGIINGLYATSMGIGGLVPIEVVHNYTATNYELNLTGMQGDIMKESMSVARTLALRLVRNIEKKVEWGIHIHCPSGATPKDGPSAGTAITVAIVSLLTGLPIRNNIAITGEIDLQGRVMTIGGLDSKIDGAKLAGCISVLCPEGNLEDLNRLRLSKYPPETLSFSIRTIHNIFQAIEAFLILPEGKSLSDYLHIPQDISSI